MKSRWQRLKREAYEARRSGDCAEAERLLLEAIEEARGFGEQDPDLAGTMNVLGDLHRAQGRLDHAERVAREGLDLRKRAQPGSLLVGNDLMFLAGVLEAKGATGEALALVREALPIYEEALGPDHGEARYIRSVVARLLAKP